ncbi:leucine-rich repeat-containing protein 49 [Thrips palmi]|uniref:Dynein axonemal assembly factor 1 homolog n=1 Tax=Thrips palmi TaxID=161013 RepID=A0A6P8ZR26_THRPL|nr:leucine-rich repeat-containing protein 49 [Thrips palmi]
MHDGRLQVARTIREKEKNPDRISLDRRGLTAVPLMPGESRVRLLSLQHNLITRMDSLSAAGLTLSRLVFLDMYDNQVDRVSGLDCLDNLRVLLMGKNRIKKIEGLRRQTRLEVLDLHGNQITSVGGLSFLCELKVLNLAGNQIRSVGASDLQGLRNLQELNLRRNRLRKLLGFGDTPHLVKLFLSNNELSSVEDMYSVAKASHLREVTIDGNPVAQGGDCVSFLVSYLPNLNMLSNLQITDPVRKAAMSWRSNKEAASSLFVQLGVGEPDGVKREEVIFNARTNWELLRSQSCCANSPRPGHGPGHASGQRPGTASGTATAAPSLDADHQHGLDGEDKPTCPAPAAPSSAGNAQGKTREQGGDYLVEISGRYLNVYGQGALRFIDRPWNAAKAADVTIVRFNYINFNGLTAVLGRLKQRFPNAEHFIFRENNLACLGQLNALADIQGLTSLCVEEEGNPIVAKQWQSYAIYRLAHWGLRTINDVEVTEEMVSAAAAEFRGLSDLVLWSLPDTLLQPLLSRLRLDGSRGHGAALPAPHHHHLSARQWLWTADPALRTVVGKEALQWRRTSLTQDDLLWRHKGRVQLGALLDMAVSAVAKLRQLESEWPSVLQELVRDTLVDYSHLHAYMKKCMASLQRL